MASPISLTIGAVDGTANAFDRVNARIEAFSKQTQTRINAATAPFRRLQAQMARFADVSGLNRVAAATRGIARAAGDAYQKIGQVVPLIGIIGGAASVAGMTRMVNAWGEWGLRVQQTSQRIGVSARQLAGLQGAASLAGSSADAMAGGLQGLGQSLYDAVGGRAPEVIVMMRTLGLNIQDATGHARNAAEVMPEVADKVASMRNPFAQMQVATALFGGAAADLLPILRLGSAGIRDYQATAQRLNPVTEEGIKAAGRLALAQRAVGQATEGLRNRIAERLEPILTPMLNHFANWIATSPEVARGVQWLGEKVQQLATWIDGGGIERFGSTVQGWLQPIGNVAHALGGDGGTLGALELLAGLMVGSFALKVIGPWVTLATAITTATTRLTRFTAAQVASAGGGGLLGRVGGLLGGLGLGALGWEGLNLAQGATEPQGNGLANLLHNMMFEMDPRHWTQSYHPGQGGGAGASSWGAPPASRPTTEQQRVGARDTIGYLVSKGWTPAAAAGVAGNLMQESGFDPRAQGDNGAAHGVMQWHSDRQAAIENHFHMQLGKMNLHQQLDAVDWETRTATPNTFARMQQMSAGQAGATFSLEAERPGDADGEARRRYGLANQSLNDFRAQGAPLALASPSEGANTRDATVRLQLDGRMDKGMSMSVAGAQGATVEGPLVTKPQLLGAMP